MSNSHQPVTARDLAKAAGVSEVTIYLALQNNPRISEKRRLQIQQLAREMGYWPNAMASILARQRHARSEKSVRAALGWINLFDPAKDFKLYRELKASWVGATAAAELAGFHLDEIIPRPGAPLKELEKILIARGISGLLLSPTRETPNWADFHWERFSVVRIGRTMPAPEFHVVTANQVVNTISAFHHMLDLGYQRVGFACGSAWLTGRLFSAGFLQARSELPKRRWLGNFVVNSFHPNRQIDQFARWLKTEKPDAILTDTPAVRTLLKELGLRVPEDIGLAGTSILDCGVDAGVDQKPEEIGKVAVNRLISLMQHSERGIPEILTETLIQGQWHDGTTLPSRNPTGAKQSKPKANGPG